MQSKAATPDEINRALYRRAAKRHADIETQLLGSVMDYLGMIGLKPFRRNVGAMEVLDAEGKRRLVRFNEPGQSDVWAIGPEGVHIEIELKKPNAGARSEPTRTQGEWLGFVRSTGAIGLCVTSLGELSRLLRDEYGRRGWKWRPTWSVQ